MGCVDGVLSLSTDGVGGFRGGGWGCLEVEGSTMSGRDCPSGLGGYLLEAGPALSEVGTEEGVHAEWVEDEGSPSGEVPDVEANPVFVCDIY